MPAPFAQSRAKAVYGGYVAPNFLYPTLFFCTAMMSLAAWYFASRMHRNSSAPQIELMTQTSELDDTEDKLTGSDSRYCTYSSNNKKWSDSGSYAETSADPEAPETPSTPEHRLCPRCSSEHVEKRNQARKAVSTIGAVAGATSGVAMTLSGAEVGATVGLIAGPIGSVFGGLAGAILAGLAASAAGCAAGAAMGEVIDENVLDNHRCMTCGHTFNASA